MKLVDVRTLHLEEVVNQHCPPHSVADSPLEQDSQSSNIVSLVKFQEEVEINFMVDEFYAEKIVFKSFSS